MARKLRTRSGDQANKEFAVIGLGGFGASLARRLETLGHMVLGVDSDIDQVQAISDDITSAVALDITNENALQEIDIGSFGTAIVAIDDDFEASALVTSYLKGLGIPRVICLGETRRHQGILERIGADQVIVSDEDSGVRLAETLAAPKLLERVLLDADHSLAELKAPESLAAQPISNLARYDVTVLLIQRQGSLIACPGGEIQVTQGDTLFIVGRREKLLEVGSLP